MEYSTPVEKFMSKQTRSSAPMKMMALATTRSNGVESSFLPVIHTHTNSANAVYTNGPKKYVMPFPTLVSAYASDVSVASNNHASRSPAVFTACTTTMANKNGSKPMERRRSSITVPSAPKKMMEMTSIVMLMY